MNRGIFFVLLATLAMLMPGCGSMDNSMAGSAVDIPPPPPEDSLPPVFTNSSPSPTPAASGQHVSSN
jgi:hypothetical protein